MERIIVNHTLKLKEYLSLYNVKNKNNLNALE